MSAKKTILILCDWFLPGYLAGGPIQSIATLTQHLGNDVNFKIITTDRDFKSQMPYDNISINTWTNHLGREVFYVSPENLNATFLLTLIQSVPHDVLYLNSMFSKVFTVYPLQWKRQGKLKSQIVLAPRGMLRDGALSIKPLKKQLYLRYAKLFGLFKDIHWQSTSTEETQEIKKRISKKVSITEVSNFPATVSSITKIEKKKGELKLCFIARILGIKNLDFAIEVLQNVKDYTLAFDVYGPKEDLEYWNTCEANSKKLPSNVSFNYKGSLRSEEVGDVLNKYHALFLPTHTENFGHIIVQSLTHGRPVIISDNTPWRNLEAENVGADISLNDKTKFIETIIRLANMEQPEFDRMSQDSVKYIHSKLNIEDIKQKYLMLFGAK